MCTQCILSAFDQPAALVASQRPDELTPDVLLFRRRLVRIGRFLDVDSQFCLCLLVVDWPRRYVRLRWPPGTTEAVVRVAINVVRRRARRSTRSSKPVHSQSLHCARAELIHLLTWRSVGGTMNDVSKKLVDHSDCCAQPRPQSRGLRSGIHTLNTSTYSNRQGQTWH